MKRISSSFIAILLGLAPAALANPNQVPQAQQPQAQSWNEQSAWNEQAPQPQQAQPQQAQPQWQQPQWQQPQQQQQPEPEQVPEAQEEQGWQNQPGPQPSWQQPQQQPPPAWQQPTPNAGWQQQQSQSWNQQGPMAQGPSESDTYEFSETSGPHLGILVEGMTPELRAYFGVPNDRGVLVARIQRNSPAQRAGIQVGDVLMAVQGQPVTGANDVLQTLAQLSRGEIVHLDVMRSGRRITLRTQLTPTERPMYRSQG